nr:hypothetical protein [uncultured Undibacterium sp.]
MRQSLDFLLPKVVQIAIDAGAAILDIYQFYRKSLVVSNGKSDAIGPAIG